MNRVLDGVHPSEATGSERTERPNHCSFRSGSNMLLRVNLIPLLSLSFVYWLSDGLTTKFFLHIVSNSEWIWGARKIVFLAEAAPGTVPVLLISTSKQSTFFAKVKFLQCIVGELCSPHWNLVLMIACTSWSFIFKSTVPEGGKRHRAVPMLPRLSPGLDQCKHDCVRLRVYVFSMTSRLNLLCLQVGDTFSNRWHCKLERGA